jgi:ribosomal protein L11 methyltransferase
VRVTVAAAEVDDVSGRLWLAGAGAIAEATAGDSVELIAGFADPTQADLAAAMVGGRVEAVDGDAWLDAWRSYARVVRAGRLVVVPAWIDPPSIVPGDIHVDIDPGRVFGHGGHPTTRLVLEELDRRVAGGEHVLDVGCGSGVLGIAAAKLGAARVLGIDIDPDAVTVTKDNAERNRVPVDASTTPLAEISERFDIVVANIGADVLIELAPALTARGAVLVLSGLLVDRVDDVASAYAGTKAVSTLEGWAALTVTA